MSEIHDTLRAIAALDHPHIFPLSAGSRRPPYGFRWRDEATNDPREQASLQRRHPGANWGVATGPSGLVVVDVDEHGVSGTGTLRELCQEHGPFPATFTVTTPSGGRHYYFRGQGRSSVGALGPGIDTRGKGGYVVAPGSVVDGVTYHIEDDSPPAPLPPWIEEALRQSERRVADAMVDLDQDHAVMRAIRFLEDEPPAIEGEGGDTHTYRTCCALRDLGISADMTLDLLVSIWNPRCEPPWDDQELSRKVENAYNYAKNTHGCADPTVAFPAVTQAMLDALPPLPRERIRAKRQPLTADAIDIDAIPPRQWVLGHRLIRGYVSLLVAPGGAGKSIYSVTEALAVASGLPLTGEKVHRPGPVLMLNTEDPTDEIQRKLAAANRYYDLDRSVLAKVHYLSALAEPMRVVRSDHDGAYVDEAEVQWIIDYCIEHRIRLLVIDPLIRFHGINENDNAEMDLMTAVLARIANETQVAILLCHHTRKMSGQAHGDAEHARGASSLVTAARIAATLSTMTVEEAEKLGVPEDVRWRYLRLDNAKSNLAPPATRAQWLVRESVALGQGDSVGVIRPARQDEIVDEMAESTMGVAVAVRQAIARDPDTVIGALAVDVARLLTDTYGIDLGGHRRPRDVVRALRRRLGSGVITPHGLLVMAHDEHRQGRPLVLQVVEEDETEGVGFGPLDTHGADDTPPDCTRKADDTPGGGGK